MTEGGVDRLSNWIGQANQQIAMKRKAFSSCSSIAMKKKKTRVEENGSSISDLPQVLLQHIQYFLSPKQAAQTTTLSKSWQNTLSHRPNIDLHELSFLGTKHEFLSHVYKILQGYHDHKLRVNEFKLELDLDSKAHVSLLNKWIPILIHMGVKMFHLILDIAQENYLYTLPTVVFESESIIELCLQGCWLDHEGKSIMFKHLKVVHLSEVFIEQITIEAIISNCPLIEDMKLVRCEGLRSFSLNNLQNLKKFYFVCNIEEIEVPLIEWTGATNLESITICGSPKVKFQSFPNLKDLSLTKVCLSGVTLNNNLWCYFPSLENLELNNCYGLEEIEIMSHSIKHISMQMDSHRLVKTHIDAPNIVSFEYLGDRIPANLSFAKTCSIWNSDISLNLKDEDALLWLLKLNEMLKGGLSQSKIYLFLNKLPVNNNNNINIDVRFEPVEVDKLSFPFSPNYVSSAIINALFSVCRPKKVGVLWYVKEYDKYSRESNEFTEDVCKMLMETRKKKECIWEADLKEVRLSVLDDSGGRDEWRPLHGTSLRKCALPENGHVREIRFQLKWRGFGSVN